MKKLLLVLLLTIPVFCFAQTDTSKRKPKEEYCMIIATAKLFSTKVTIQVDHGQETHLFSNTGRGPVTDNDGKVMSFNSVIDALNYMSTQGWFYVNAYAVSEGSSGGKVLNYIMRRPID